ncbi:MAG: HAMP domain-containing sensor histidine kinase [bacterium]|nr:HAMP domain-containing sensor histidine kinase [bacterium]
MSNILLAQGSKETVRSLINAFQKNLEINIHVAKTKAEALTLLQNKSFDFILVPANAGKKKNQELCNQLRQADSGRNASILFFAEPKVGSEPTLSAVSHEADQILDISDSRLTLADWLNLRLSARQVQKSESAAAFSLLGDADEFIGALVHTVRNPLTGISTNVQYLQMVYSDSNAQKEIYVDVMEAVHRLDLLFRDLVDYVRPMDLQREKVDLNEMIAAAIKNLDNQVRNRNLKITHNLDPVLNQIEVDRSRFSRVVNGLCEFCVYESIGKGTIEISSDAQDNAVTLNFAAIAANMDAARLETLFTPTASLKRTATGLGLALVKRVLNEHGMSIRASLEKDNRLTFVIKIPMNL